jgi:uncharacterized DUF497 family protein
MDIFPLPFEWDEAKRATNIAKHGLDFIDAPTLFDGRPCVTFPSPRAGETRFVTVGRLDGVFVALVWTERGAATRVISFRRARHAEARNYCARLGGRAAGDA